MLCLAATSALVVWFPYGCWVAADNDGITAASMLMMLPSLPIKLIFASVAVTSLLFPSYLVLCDSCSGNKIAADADAWAHRPHMVVGQVHLVSHEYNTPDGCWNLLGTKRMADDTTLARFCVWPGPIRSVRREGLSFYAAWSRPGALSSYVELLCCRLLEQQCRTTKMSKCQPRRIFETFSVQLETTQSTLSDCVSLYRSDDHPNPIRNLAAVLCTVNAVGSRDPLCIIVDDVSASQSTLYARPHRRFKAAGMLCLSITTTRWWW